MHHAATDTKIATAVLPRRTTEPEGRRQGRRRRRKTGARITFPANAIAEWRGRTDRRDYVRKMFGIIEVDEQIAKFAGKRWRGSSGVMVRSTTR
jgi:hypothetical protein